MSDDESAGSYGSDKGDFIDDPSAPRKPKQKEDTSKPAYLPRINRDRPVERSNTMPLVPSSKSGLFKHLPKKANADEDDDSVASAGSKHSHESEKASDDDEKDDESESEKASDDDDEEEEDLSKKASDDDNDDDNDASEGGDEYSPLINVVPFAPLPRLDAEQRKSLLPGQVPMMFQRPNLTPSPSLRNFDPLSPESSPSRNASVSNASPAAASLPARHPAMLQRHNNMRTLRRSQFLSALDLQLCIVKMTESGIIDPTKLGGGQNQGTTKRLLEVPSDTESDSSDSHSDEEDEKQKERFINEMKQTSPKEIQRRLSNLGPGSSSPGLSSSPSAGGSNRNIAKSPSVRSASPDKTRAKSIKKLTEPPKQASPPAAKNPSIRPVRSRRRSTVVLSLDHGTSIVVTHEKKMAKKKARMRRHSFHAIPTNTPLTMFHELRQFYDLSYRVFLVKAQLRSLAMATLQISPFVPRNQRMTKEAAWLFSLVDEDGSGFIDVNELKIMIRETGQKVKDEEVEHIMQLLDIDGSGEVDNVEFLEWYMDDKDIWLSKRRKNKADMFKDTNLLARESMRFHPVIKKLINDFWRLVDVDGNGQIDPDEYVELSLQLQEAMTGKGKTKFDQANAIAIAKKEWQVDSQGFDYLNYHRFQLCFFQIADSWAKAPTVNNYAKVLGDLINKTSFIPKSGGPRKWKWNRNAGEEDGSVESIPKIEDKPTPKPQKPPPNVVKVEKPAPVAEAKTAMRSPKPPKKEVTPPVDAGPPKGPEPAPKVEVAVAPQKVEETVGKKDEEEKKPVARAKVPVAAPQAVDRKPLFTAPAEGVEKKVFVKKSDRDAAKEAALADKKEEVAKKEQPPPPVFAQASYHSEDEDAEVKKARKKAENYKWEPPEELFSPGKQRPGVAGGGYSGVHAYAKVDKEAENENIIMIRKRRMSMVAKNERVDVSSRINIEHQIRKKITVDYMIEQISQQQTHLMERTRRIGDELFFGSHFVDTNMLWNMINKLKKLAKESEGMPPTEDELSLGYAAKKLLQNWESTLDREESQKKEGPEVGDHKPRRFQISSTFNEVAVPAEGVRTDRKNLTTIIRPKSSSGFFKERNNVDERGRSGTRDGFSSSDGSTSPRADGPGIGPIFDSDRVMYPLSVTETDDAVIYQIRNVVTGQLKVPPAAAAAGHMQPFFLNAWERQRDDVREDASYSRATQRPNTAGAAGEGRKGGGGLNGTPPIAPRATRKSFDHGSMEGRGLVESLEDAFAVRRRQKSAGPDSRSGRLDKSRERFEMPNVYTKNGKTFTKLFG